MDWRELRFNLQTWRSTQLQFSPHSPPPPPPTSPHVVSLRAQRKWVFFVFLCDFYLFIPPLSINPAKENRRRGRGRSFSQAASFEALKRGGLHADGHGAERAQVVQDTALLGQAADDVPPEMARTCQARAHRRHTGR